MENEQFFISKVVILNGAAGFIGSHLTDKLLQAGARVIGIDNLITGKRANLAEAEKNTNFAFVQHDLNDAAGTVALLGQIQAQYGAIDLVFQLASPASPRGYQQHPVETYLVNSYALHIICQWLRDHSPQTRLLFSSTSEAYGNPEVHPQVETYWGNVNPNGPRSCYDESKRLGEAICGIFYRNFGLNTRIIRIFNTYGPRMDLEDGRVLPQFVRQIKNGEPLTVYGDGLQTRSYCFVDDLVEGICRFMASQHAGETVNLGNPGEYTVLETARIANAVAGRDPEMLEYRELPVDDPLRRQPNIDKARQLFGWQPQISFDEGIRRMFASYGIL